ncbi:GNAT family N-acetyltransferase [Sphingosinicella rhizophila]|uniref:GNAT family N-acetyltransferase n=1 Tax=Sphingosinicella rhizophila TaxID=3050082 RepID=A0ABU3Q3Q2_9SPHN|nr:GNAT family N-acetyltransferase [Sphingosinicella sp. GR2756]MDT9597902.1 GNAT family N-acetyltransferase [Sphingosinicella sp. GR2756]
MNDIVIETERLRLRNWRSGDDLLLDRHCNTEGVMRWLGGVASREAIAEAVARCIDWQTRLGYTYWVVERTSDREFLGFCGLRPPDCQIAGGDDLEIGWRLREDSWGMGYAREAAAACLRFAFDRIGTKRVIALTCEANVASWRLMEGLGMRRRADLDYWDEGSPAEMNPFIVYELEEQR